MDGMQDTDPGAAAAGAAPPLLLLSKDLLDRVLVARLIEEAPEAHPQQPLHYLLGVYARTLDEARSRAVAEHSLMPTLQAVRDLVVNYAGLVLMGGVVPQVGAVRVCMPACVGGCAYRHACAAPAFAQMHAEGGAGTQAGHAACSTILLMHMHPRIHACCTGIDGVHGHAVQAFACVDAHRDACTQRRTQLQVVPGGARGIS